MAREHGDNKTVLPPFQLTYFVHALSTTVLWVCSSVVIHLFFFPLKTSSPSATLLHRYLMSLPLFLLYTRSSQVCHLFVDVLQVSSSLFYPFSLTPVSLISSIYYDVSSQNHAHYACKCLTYIVFASI